MAKLDRIERRLIVPATPEWITVTVSVGSGFPTLSFPVEIAGNHHIDLPALGYRVSKVTPEGEITHIGAEAAERYRRDVGIPTIDPVDGGRNDR
jgi:hypothetical protein